MRLADQLALSDVDRVSRYHASLLRFPGCTVDAHRTAEFGDGDDLQVNVALAATIMQPGREELAAALRVAGAGRPVRTRLGLIARMLTDLMRAHLRAVFADIERVRLRSPELFSSNTASVPTRRSVAVWE